MYTYKGEVLESYIGHMGGKQAQRGCHIESHATGQKSSSNGINMQKDSYPGYKLHQIGPYIGKMNSPLARRLVLQYTKPDGWVWDPFCGSGTIPLECRLLSRNVIAADVNPYACALTRAKLHAPTSKTGAILKLHIYDHILSSSAKENLVDIPQWVQDFFHEQTLRKVINLFHLLLNDRQYFSLGCLLGILHHQRPGFLSYPASHLVPYLRNKLYPQSEYPEAYEYRDPVPRLKAKIERILENPPPSRTRFRVLQMTALKKYLPDAFVDAVITSPPYMDALDYSRDNRLRLWFLDVGDYNKIKPLEIGKIGTFVKDMTTILQLMSRIIKPGGVCVLVLGDMKRTRKKYDIPAIISKIIHDEVKEFRLESQWEEKLPDQRRSRRNGQATQTEVITVFRRNNGG